MIFKLIDEANFICLKFGLNVGKRLEKSAVGSRQNEGRRLIEVFSSFQPLIVVCSIIHHFLLWSASCGLFCARPNAHSGGDWPRDPADALRTHPGASDKVCRTQLTLGCLTILWEFNFKIILCRSQNDSIHISN